MPKSHEAPGSLSLRGSLGADRACILLGLGPGGKPNDFGADEMVRPRFDSVDVLHLGMRHFHFGLSVCLFPTGKVLGLYFIHVSVM